MNSLSLEMGDNGNGSKQWRRLGVRLAFPAIFFWVSFSPNSRATSHPSTTPPHTLEAKTLLLLADHIIVGQTLLTFKGDILVYKRMPKACSEAALSLLTCMEESPCVKKDGQSIYECLKNDKDDECKAQRNAYYLCKHSQLNMRTRIRGPRAY